MCGFSSRYSPPFGVGDQIRPKLSGGCDHAGNTPSCSESPAFPRPFSAGCTMTTVSDFEIRASIPFSMLV